MSAIDANTNRQPMTKDSTYPHATNFCHVASNWAAVASGRTMRTACTPGVSRQDGGTGTKAQVIGEINARDTTENIVEIPHCTTTLHEPREDWQWLCSSREPKSQILKMKRPFREKAKVENDYNRGIALLTFLEQWNCFSLNDPLRRPGCAWLNNRVRPNTPSEAKDKPTSICRSEI